MFENIAMQHLVDDWARGQAMVTARGSLSSKAIQLRRARAEGLVKLCFLSWSQKIGQVAKVESLA
jgi:hypothetical protein